MEQKAAKVRFVPSMRLGVACLSCFGAVSLYMIRINFGISIVCMTIDPQENETFTNVSSSVDECEEISQTPDTTGEFAWDRTTRGILNSAFYLGYAPSQIPSGLLAQKLGMKWVHLSGLTFATLMSLLGPVSAELSEWALFVTRFFLGVGCAVFVSPIRGVIGCWSPEREQSTMYSIYSTGYSIGSVLAFSITGALCDGLGWESTFYIPSLFMVVYIISFGIFGANGPETSHFLSAKEKKYIIGTRTKRSQEKVDIPWRGIFTSMPCWAIFICDFCSAWGSYTVLTSGAQYMHDVLKFDISANGGYNALPHVCAFIATLSAGLIFDAIYRRFGRSISKTNIRKIAQSIGFLVPASMMIGMSFMECDRREVAIAMLCLAMAGQAFLTCGMFINAMEIAPKFVPVIGGIQNTFGNVAGIICPIVAGILTPNGAKEEWANVFYIGTTFYVFGWVIYMIFADASIQSWAEGQIVENEIETENKFSKTSDEIWNTGTNVVVREYAVIGEWNSKTKL